MRSKVLGSPALALRTKLQFTRSLMETRLMHGACTWTIHEPSVLAPIDRIRVVAWRAALRCANVGRGPGQRVSDAHVWASVRQPPASTLARVARLRYLRRFYASSPAVLTALCQGTASFPGTWTAQMAEDVRELQFFAGDAHPIAALPPPLESAAPWAEYFRGGAAAWSPLVRAYARQCSCAPMPPAQHTGACAGLQLPASRDHSCTECGRAFAEWSHLMGHMARVHGRKNELRRYVFADHCPICLRVYWANERTLHHYLRSACGQLVMANFLPMGHAAHHRLDENARHVQRTMSVRAEVLDLPPRPASRQLALSGPMPKWAMRDMCPSFWT